MGQAKQRGTFEERKAMAVAKLKPYKPAIARRYVTPNRAVTALILGAVIASSPVIAGAPRKRR